MKATIFGFGYLGHRVAAAWLRAGYELSAVTRSVQKAAQLNDAGIRPFVADVCDAASLTSLPEVDIVFHAIGFDRNSGRTQEEVTCGGTRNVVNHFAGRCQRFIYVSSTSVYGQADGEWVDETSVCQPTQPGGQLNASAEQIVREHFDGSDASTFNILRLAGIYGPGRLLSRIDSLQSGTPITGRGDSWLNLIHVDDAVTAVTTCATKGTSGTIYNVADDRPIRRSEYFELLAELVGAPTPSFDPNQSSARGSGGLNKRIANRRLREELGWMPNYPSIETGLRSAVNNFD